MEHVETRMVGALKSGFFKGIGFGVGFLATTVFAAAAAINVFAPGDVITAAKINQNFAIAAPEGAVVAFNLAGCPEGWAPADGSAGTPDLRGVFVRGRDDVGTGPAGKDPDGSRAPGNSQADAFQGHVHETYTSSADGFGNQSIFGRGNDTLTWGIPTQAPRSDGTNGTPRTAGETRPKNVALTYCVRKN